MCPLCLIKCLLWSVTINLSGYSWHSLLALTIGGIMLGISAIRIDFIKPIYNGLLWIAKYEFGIYLWHLLLIRNLIEKSQIVTYLIGKNQYIIQILFLTLSIIVGYFMSIMVENIESKLKKTSI